MKAVLKNSVIDFMEVREWARVNSNISPQEALIAWGGGKITKGPDGGVFVMVSIAGTEPVKKYAATGKFILKNDDNEFVIFSSEEFNDKYITVEDLTK